MSIDKLSILGKLFYNNTISFIVYFISSAISFLCIIYIFSMRNFHGILFYSIFIPVASLIFIATGFFLLKRTGGYLYLSTLSVFLLLALVIVFCILNGGGDAYGIYMFANPVYGEPINNLIYHLFGYSDNLSKFPFSCFTSALIPSLLMYGGLVLRLFVNKSV